MSEQLSPLERSVLAMMLEGVQPGLRELREQLARCIVRTREHTGVGFYTDFEQLDRGTLRKELNGRIADVFGEFGESRELVGFILTIESGRLTCLEAHTYGADWPTTEPAVSLRHDPLPRTFSDLVGLT